MIGLGDRPGLLRFGWKISGNGLLYQPEVGFPDRDELALSGEITRVLQKLSVGRIEGHLFHRRTSIRCGMSFIFVKSYERHESLNAWSSIINRRHRGRAR